MQRYNFPPSWRPLSTRESYEYERMRRMANVAQALWFAKNKLPSAVRRETGEALDEALSGILRESFYMSEVMALNTKTIFVKLLNEGTDVWRPVNAEEIGELTYRIIDDGSYDPDDEEWEFPPGSEVICQMQKKSRGNILVAVSHFIEEQKK